MLSAKCPPAQNVLEVKLLCQLFYKLAFSIWVVNQLCFGKIPHEILRGYAPIILLCDAN